MKEISKKEAATIAAAIAAYLAKPKLAVEEGTSIQTSNIQEVLEKLFEKFSKLEEQMEKLNVAVEEIRGKVEKLGK